MMTALYSRITVVITRGQSKHQPERSVRGIATRSPGTCELLYHPAITGQIEPSSLLTMRGIGATSHISFICPCLTPRRSGYQVALLPNRVGQFPLPCRYISLRFTNRQAVMSMKLHAERPSVNLHYDCQKKKHHLHARKGVAESR